MATRRKAPPPTPAAIIAGMRAHAPDPATQERIDALAKRWGIKGKERPTDPLPDESLHSPASETRAT